MVYKTIQLDRNGNNIFLNDLNSYKNHGYYNKKLNVNWEFWRNSIFPQIYLYACFCSRWEERFNCTYLFVNYTYYDKKWQGEIPKCRDQRPKEYKNIFKLHKHKNVISGIVLHPLNGTISTYYTSLSYIRKDQFCVTSCSLFISIFNSLYHVLSWKNVWKQSIRC